MIFFCLYNTNSVCLLNLKQYQIQLIVIRIVNNNTRKEGSMSLKKHSPVLTQKVKHKKQNTQAAELNTAVQTIKSNYSTTQGNGFTITSQMVETKNKQKLFKIQLVKQEEQSKIRLRISQRHMRTFFPTYTTLVESQFCNKVATNEENHQNNYQMNFFKEKQWIGQQKSLYKRKKLSPLRKPKTQKKIIQQRQICNSFLNVRKASILFQTKNQIQRFMGMTTNIKTKKIFSLDRKLPQQNKLRQSIQNPESIQKNISFKQDIIKIQRRKLFSVPFERYCYFDFIWKVAYSNGIRLQFQQNIPKKYKAYVGSGNNSNLIRTLLRRREAWWAITDKLQQANFVWTQIKVNNVFNIQNNCSMPAHIDCQQDQMTAKSAIHKRNRKILNEKMTNQWIKYFQQNRQLQQKALPSFNKRNRHFKKSNQITLDFNRLQKVKVHNHLSGNFVLGNKKALFATMKKYYKCMGKNIFDIVPLTFHIQKGLQDGQFFKFLQHYYKKSKPQKANQKCRNIWIVKPGQFTNRGTGIIVCHSLQQVKSIVRNKVTLQDGQNRTYIIQQYIEKPFLYYRRKFDIRHYMLITCINGHIKGYWCELGYIRTTSYEYTLNNGYSSVHLTNDAVQKNLPGYGRFQKGNKLSYEQFEAYLQNQHRGRYSFVKTILPQMKSIAYDSMKASSLLLDPNRKQNNFQIFGFDFMIDSKFHPWLIQINTNPCLQLSCPVLMDVIPAMVENALKIGLDSIFPPPQSFQQKRARFSNNVLEDNKFQLLYDSVTEQQQINQMYAKCKTESLNFKELEQQQDEIYEDDGIQLDD